MRFLMTVAAVTLAACGADPVRAVYDRDTRLAARLDADLDRNGLIESRTYLQDGRPVRVELDLNDDGRIDRWEYYGADGTLARLGTSSLMDGREDTWVVQSGNETRVDISTRRDGSIDRREFQEAGVVRRSEQDANFDGLVDQWTEYENGRMRAVLMDTTQAAGRPDRRLVYDAAGTITSIEADPDGDGRFEPVQEGRSEP